LRRTVWVGLATAVSLTIAGFVGPPGPEDVTPASAPDPIAAPPAAQTAPPGRPVELAAEEGAPASLGGGVAHDHDTEQHDHAESDEPVLAGGAIFDEEAPDCLEPVPAAAGVSGITDDRKRVGLEVLVLLDGVTRSAAEAIVGRAAAAYALVDVELRAVDYDAVSFSGVEPAKLISLAKQHVGGRRPAGADLVYVMTDKDLAVQGSNAVAGQADCIGGVRYASRAFAVGEAKYPSIPVGPFRFLADVPAKVLAHELGHLMGGHHHYANCVEGALIGAAAVTEASPCSLMTNFVDFMSLRFSALEGAVVRGHARRYA
jgi:predicted Zn-dependent protease